MVHHRTMCQSVDGTTINPLSSRCRARFNFVWCGVLCYEYDIRVYDE